MAPNSNENKKHIAYFMSNELLSKELWAMTAKEMSRWPASESQGWVSVK